MGFIKAFAGSVSGELANQWKEFYTCDSLPAQVLIRRASHMVSGRSSNKRADADDISKGSTVIVNEGQCAIFVSQGQILDVAAEPGAYTWDDGTSPSFFSGSLSDVVKKGWERFSYGGQNPVQQRIYYVNMKELLGCKFGLRSLYRSVLLMRISVWISILLSDAMAHILCMYLILWFSILRLQGMWLMSSLWIR